MRAMLFNNKRGFTLTELLVVMAIFMTVIIITAEAFKTIVDKSAQQSKSVETQIEGIVGLEVLRADLAQTGFGLPWSSPITYAEATGTNMTTAAADLFFNDAPANAPRAIVSGGTDFNKDSGGIGSTYLVIKSTNAVANDTSKKWTTVSFDKDNVKSIREWGDAGRDFTSAERVIVVKNSLTAPPPTRRQLMVASTVFSATFGTYSTVGLVSPHQNGDTFVIYGINPDTALRMPFNRADYYIKRPTDKMPASCAPNTGILYKSTIINDSDPTKGGKLSVGMPLLDCVADMQVVYGLAEPDTSVVNNHTSGISLFSAEDIRSRLREIRVYILAQEGRKDLSYRYPAEKIRVGENINGIDRGREFNLQALIGSDYKYYRWKVYTLVVRPKNLIQ